MVVPCWRSGESRPEMKVAPPITQCSVCSIQGVWSHAVKGQDECAQICLVLQGILSPSCVVWCERHTVTTPQGFEIPLWKKENPYYLLKTICRDIGIWTIANMELRTKYVLKQNRQRCEENTVKKHRFLFMPAKHIKLGLTGNPTNPALLPLSCGEGFWSSRAIKCWWLLVGRVGFCCSGFPTKTRAVCWDKALHA